MNTKASPFAWLFVSGARACFRRPEFSSDLISYDVMPPTVGRQLLKTVLGPDGWTLDRIRVCRPIRFGWDSLTTARGEKRAMILVDVAYLLDFSSTLEHVGAVEIDREVTVYLGLSNYPACARLVGNPKQIAPCLGEHGRIDLGWMIYDTRPPSTRFFRAIMTDGVIDVGQTDHLLLAW